MRIVITFLLVLLVGCSSNYTKSTGSSLDQKFGRSCYTLNAATKKQADSLMKDFFYWTQNRRTRDPNSNFSEMYRGFEYSASVGHPDALLMKCRIGADKLAPPSESKMGRAWCSVAIDLIPSLESHLDPSYVRSISSPEGKLKIKSELEYVNSKMCKP